MSGHAGSGNQTIPEVKSVCCHAIIPVAVRSFRSAGSLARHARWFQSSPRITARSQQDGPLRHCTYSRGRLEVIVLFHLPGSAVVVAEGLGNLQSGHSHRCLTVLKAAWW